jgi:uncharacterized protein YecE (DUF72 family)
MQDNIRIGTAGWTIPARCADAFSAEGSHLQRYGRRFTAVEINSSFYRSHKPGTYARWAASVPPNFRFVVKVPREITHIRKLADAVEPLERFLSEVETLGSTLGPLLVQLPPSLGFDVDLAEPFFGALRARFDGNVVCEPRHAGWFSDAAGELLRAFRIARVAADPAPVPSANEPGGWPGIVYRRLHGSPKMYSSAYSEQDLDVVAPSVRQAAEAVRESWCIFDNTMHGAACENAMALLRRL